MDPLKRALSLSGLVLAAMLLAAGCATQPSKGPAEADKEPALAEKARMAVEDAEKAVKEAQEATDGEVPSQATLDLLSDAQGNLEQENYQKAIDQAEEVQRRVKEELKEYRKAKKAQAQEAQEKQVANGVLMAAPGADKGTYRVGEGDTLWDISAAEAIYGDPFAWPLIYKYNSEDIHDPDLIHPDQELMIQFNPGSREYDAAVRHAKTRGAWSLGEPEASDLEYLEGN